MFRSRDLRVYPYFDEQEYEVNNSKMHCDTSPDTYRLHERWVLRLSSINQVNWQGQRQFRRCTRQRDALQVYNVDNCYKSKDNSYSHPTRGNRIRSIATSTITIGCSQLSSTKRCRERDWRERLLPLNAYDWRQPNEKSPDDDIWVNTVTLHDPVLLHSHFPESTSHSQCAPMEERLSANEIRLQRSTTRWKFTYEEMTSGEPHLR